MSELPPPPPPPGGSPVPPPPPFGSSDYPAPPPAHPEQGFVGHYHHGFQRLGKNARSLIVLLVLFAAAQIITIPMQFAVHGKARDYLNGKISADTFKNAVNTLSGVSAMQTGFNVAIIVITMIWMRKLIVNHRLLGRPYSSWGPGWAVGGWFVPPGAVYAVPWLIFKELWRGSDPANVPNDPAWKQRPVAPIVHIWWVVYGFLPLVGGIVGAGIGVSGLSAVTGSSSDHKLADLYTNLFAVQIISSLVMVLAAAVYGKLVLDLTKRQQALTGEA